MLRENETKPGGGAAVQAVPCARRWQHAIARAALCLLLSSADGARSVAAQYAEENDDSASMSEDTSGPSFTLNAMMKFQGGVFAPLASDGFQNKHENRAYERIGPGQLDYTSPCDPVAFPTRFCTPVDHGQKPGSPSIGRAVLQIEGHWDVSSKVALHSIVRGVRSMQLPGDAYGQPPLLQANPDERRNYAQEYVQQNYYNELDLREFYADLNPRSWLSFRIGRQQIAWGETGQYRLLDVVNPVNNTWHFGPLESFEDQRIPLWMWLTTVDVPKLNGALELLWIPLIDRKKDTVTVPLTFAGAWGVPYTDSPPGYTVQSKDFRYPGHQFKDMRGGLRWKGTIGQRTSYSLVYMYTHQQSPPVPQYLQLATLPSGGFDSNNAERVVLTFPRQHIAGFSLEHSFDSPIGVLARLEVAVEPNRTYPSRVDQNINITAGTGRVNFAPSKEAVVSYAVVLQRPTMIRFLNPTQNVLLVGQFMHTVVPTLDTGTTKALNLVEVPGLNQWAAQKNSFRVIFYATTTYLHGLITPRFTGVWIPDPYAPDSGFYSLDVGFRIGPMYRVNVTATDFIGKRAYRNLGLFRDRDEIAASFAILF